MALECRELMPLVPHRLPFLMIDRIEEIEPQKYALALKNVTVTEPCFEGHFPDNPIVPGVLIIEALAQVAGLVMEYKPEPNGNGLKYLVEVKDMKFRKPVVPGDTMMLRVTFQRSLGQVHRFEVDATVRGDSVATGIIALANVPS